MEQEIIYIVSQKTPDGRWNKLVKSQEHFWWSEDEARNWLEKQDDIIKVSCAVFEVLVSLPKIKKVYDLKEEDNDRWEKLRKRVYRG